MGEEPTVLDIANATTLDGDLLADVYTMEASAPADEHKRRQLRRDRLVEFLQNRGEDDHERLRALVASIEIRQVALERLIKNGDAPGFAGSAPREGMSRVHRDLFRCAALEPIVRIGGQVGFDPAGFQRRLLSFTEVRGSA